MRTILIGLASMAMLAANMPAASAANSRWCSTGNIGSFSPTRCDFQTFAQCRATVQGVGGSCIENPDYAFARRRGNEPRSRDRDNRQWR